MLVVLVGSLVAGCGGSTKQTTSAPVVASQPAAGAPTVTQAASAPAAAPGTAVVASGAGAAVTLPTPAATAAVPDILAFTAATVGGGSFDGAAYAGKPVAFWFWAPT